MDKSAKWLPGPPRDTASCVDSYLANIFRSCSQADCLSLPQTISGYVTILRESWHREDGVVVKQALPSLVPARFRSSSLPGAAWWMDPFVLLLLSRSRYHACLQVKAADSAVVSTQCLLWHTTWLLDLRHSCIPPRTQRTQHHPLSWRDPVGPWPVTLLSTLLLTPPW